jgi:RsiW-degrading membrane proteinase PrsW (M82 family)
MFGSWLSNQNSKIRALIWVGIAALCWALWETRNDIIFHKIKYNSILQVIFRGAYWLHFWAQLQRDENNKNLLSSLSTKLEIVSLEQANRGCKHLYRLL